MATQVTTFSQPARAQAARIWPRAAVFDCDGLLVDTQACWHAAYLAAASAVDRPANLIDFRALAGASIASAASTLSADLDAVISPRLIARLLHDAFDQFDLQPMPGAHRLLTAIAAAGLPVAVASNAPRTLVSIALTRTNLQPLIPTIVSAESTSNPKPHPDVYQLACRQLGVDPTDAIGLEDSAVGATAARQAGLTVIAAPVAAATRAIADLSVPRLDDPRTFELLGVTPVSALTRTLDAPAARRGRATPGRELHTP